VKEGALRTSSWRQEKGRVVWRLRQVALDPHENKRKIMMKATL
jgi:hypothetical protein